MVVRSTLNNSPETQDEAPERSLDEHLDRVRAPIEDRPKYEPSIGPLHSWLLSESFDPQNSSGLHEIMMENSPEYREDARKKEAEKEERAPKRYVACADSLHLSTGLSIWANLNWDILMSNFGRDAAGRRIFAVRDPYTMASERRYVSDDFVSFIQSEFEKIKKVDMRKREERSNGIKKRRIREDDDLIDETSRDGARNKRRDGVTGQISKRCLKRVRFLEPVEQQP